MMTSPLILLSFHWEFVAQVSQAVEPSSGGFKLLAVFLLIAINAFFVAAEFSIVSVRRSRINQLVSAGDIQARTVQNLQSSLDRLLSTTQLGITLSSLALGWIGESAVVSLVAQWLNYLPIATGMTQGLAHSLAIPVTFIGIAYLQIVLGELCPKSVALLYPEELARVLGAPSLAIARIFNPFIWILNQSTRLLLRLGGIQYTGQGWYNQVTPEELQLIITTSSESTGLEAEERELLRNVFEFGEVTTGEVMVPRTSIAAISSDATLKMVLEEVAESGHSRYPVIGESLDDIRGIIHFKELADPIANDTLLHQTIEQWIRPTRFVQEYMPLNELLVLMQRSRQPMVMVVDEFGGTAGLVTIEDVVAEILGDTIEPDSTEEQPIQILDPQTFLVQAQINLEELNETLNLELPLTDAYQTLGGFILFQLQRIPEPGETLQYSGYEFTVTSTDGPRLNQIRIYRLETPASEISDDSELRDLVEPSTGDPVPPSVSEDDAMFE
ncbi:MAG: HlyC/CorC family transporter [Oscillatoriales cyanobacterium C42_A2020_001]|nr:HlyC/CorC family transporter [Leptolyngbyaceae cyanobacterium C42_A2020_001]